MGIMRFDLGTEELREQFPRFEHAYFTNYEGAAQPTKIECDGRELRCIRQKPDSGKLNIVWPVRGHGFPLLRTCSLIEREEPYVLALELARGQLGDLRDQAAAWAHAGMLIPQNYVQAYRKAYKLFTASSFQQQNPSEAARLANESLSETCAAEEILARSYIDQRIQVRRQRLTHPPALIGCDLGEAAVSRLPERFDDAFDAAGISLDWKSIEPVEGEYCWDLYDEQIAWAEKQELILKGGPLLSFQEGDLPGWLENWRHDILNLQSFLSSHVETVVSRYAGKIRIWEVAARMNTGGLYAYTEENLLALTARMIDVVRQVDSESQIFVRIDRPWGDYQAQGKHRLTPWHVVDALVRSGLGLTGINLELAIGYGDGQNDDRRLLRFSRLLDTWGSFGLPVYVTIACPSSCNPDSLASWKKPVDRESWKAPWSEQSQVNWLNDALLMLMAKQSVAGVFWSHLDDAAPHRFPQAGLLTEEGKLKPAFQRIANYRSEGK